MRDEEDASPAATALREAEEEVGLPPTAAQVVGVSFPFVTRHNILVFPVLARLTDRDYEPRNNEEVELSFWLPLSRFLSDSGRTVRSLRVKGRVFSTNVFLDDVGEESVVTFGITSYVAIVIASIVYRRKPHFEFPIGRDTKDLSWLQVLEKVPTEMLAYIQSQASKSRL